MNFDQLGDQRVYKRRKPSPVKAKRPYSFHGADFPQHVWPRHRSAADSAASAGQKAPESKRRTSSSFSIPLSWLKNIAIAAGILVIAIVGPNWDNIAAKFKAIEVSIKSLEDPSAPLDDFMEARVLPFGYDLHEFPQDEGQNPALPFEDDHLNLTDTFSWIEYRVKPGDTVSGIAEKYSLSMGSIISFNQLNEAWNLRSGRVLKIPNMDGISYTIQKGDTISTIAAKMKVPQNAILDANEILSENIPAGKVIFIPGGKMDSNDLSRAIKRPVVEKMIYPVSNRRVTSAFGWREDPVNPVAGQMTFHRAVDLAGRMGDPVKASLKGTVLHVDNNRNLGNFIILKHGDYQTLYAHLSAVSVKAGEEVSQGQVIGKVGETGYTTGPHLHFEVFYKGNRVNPLELLK
jgi:murein DD-endopeptidase MepM/ murein hydrolase activator NlpD